MATNNLTGISGKIGSGKDEIGLMIQYLNDSSSKFQSFSQWKFIQGLAPLSNWKIKKFADKLKDIVCLLIGCTRDQLEDREFKEKELGEEWQGYQVSWDCPMDEWEGFFKTEKEALNYLLERGAHHWDLSKAYEDRLIRKFTLTPRKLLQLLGTDCGRKIIHPNIWVNALFSDYKAGFEFLPQSNGNKIKTPIYPNWIITDVRFPNEVEAIKKRGGIVIRVDRPCKECGGMGYHKMDCNVGRTEHESEYALDNYEGFDHVIENDGTIEDLLEKVKTIL